MSITSFIRESGMIPDGIDTISHTPGVVEYNNIPRRNHMNLMETMEETLMRHIPPGLSVPYTPSTLRQNLFIESN